MADAAEDFDIYEDTGEVQNRLFPKAEPPIRQDLTHTHVPGAITELRAIDATGLVKSSQYTDLDVLAHHAAELNKNGYATYACINPLCPDLVRDVPPEEGIAYIPVSGLNSFPEKGCAAADDHIAELRYLVYDVDPMRQADGKPLVGADGKKIQCAATDAEKESARTVAMRVYDFYFAKGVFPVLVDSGNGFYVLVPISLKREEKYLCAAILSRHAGEFNLDDAEIDQSCSNPSRILRVPGTKNCKGKQTPDRPHRMCRVLIPGNRERVLTTTDLQQLVPEAQPPKPIELASGGVGLEAHWMECFLEYSEILHEPRQSTSAGGYKWLLEPNEDYCPNHAEHTAPDNPTTLAVFVLPNGKFGMRCHHGHCSEIDPRTGQYKMSWKNFRAAAEARNVAAGRESFSLNLEDLIPESEAGYTFRLHWFADKELYNAFIATLPAVEREKHSAAVGEYGCLQTYAELRRRRQNAKPYLVDSICRRGQIVVVVGDSSLGKSALVNQLGWAIATGQPFLGRATQQAKALVIDIENSADQQLELAECFRKMFNQAEFPETIAVPESIWTDVAGQRQVEHFIGMFQPGVVVIDSLKSFQSEAEKAGKENGLFMQWARRITKTYDCAMVLVHHPRKPAAEANGDAPWLGNEQLPVITWMNGAAGAKGLINLADVRWGVDRSHDEKECFVMRINERTVGDSGVMRVIREYDDEGREAGYSLRHGLSLLTDGQIEKYMTLPQEFHFTDVCVACGGAKSVASRLINRAKQAGALKQVGRGRYAKIRTADADETESRVEHDKNVPF